MPMPQKPSKRFDWDEGKDYKVDIDKYIDQEIMDCREIIKDSTQPIKDSLFRFVIAVDLLEIFIKSKGYLKDKPEDKFYIELNEEIEKIKKENPTMDENRLDSIKARIKFGKIMKRISDSDDHISEVEV